MHAGDRARKSRLVRHGYRLPSALDNRPLRDDEFWDRAPARTLFVSATPGPTEMRLAGGRCVDMTIRPTYVPDPAVEVRPTKGQLDDLAREVGARTEKDERVLALTLTKRDAEDLSSHLKRHGVAADYIHSGLKTHERSRALNALQAGDVDCLVGVNVLREGLDLPQVSLVAILGADVEGFLRSETALLQMVGRAARNVNGKAILYADSVTKSMRSCMEATGRRRTQQLRYNELHGKEMRSAVGSSTLSIFEILKDQIQAERTSELEVAADDSRGVPSVGLDGRVRPAVSVTLPARGHLQTDHVPSKPGVYFWKDDAGDVLYIGKAKRLRSRVKSYLAPGARHGWRTQTMLKKARFVEFILTPSERDALLLEASLIRHHQPLYNVLLKDDESYPFICASVGDPLPSFSVVPRPLTGLRTGGYEYFGPYPDLREINEILMGIEDTYDLRSKSFQVRFGNMMMEEYGAEFRQALEEVFLSPDASRPLPAQRSKYEGASQLFRHEHNRERDVVSIAKFDNGVEALIHIVQLRDGLVAGRYSYSCKLGAGIGCEQDMGSLIQSGLEKHYLQGDFSQTKYRPFPFFPKELLVQYKLPDAKNLRALFRQQISYSSSSSHSPDKSVEVKKGSAKLTIRTPTTRGRRKETDERAMSFALDNAEEEVRQRVLAATEGAALTSLDGTAARELAELLSLGPVELNRIEAFDISHTKGDVAVGSRVVFESGKPVKEDYRRFNIRSVDGIDDYASLEEVLNRRFSRAWINGKGGLAGGNDPWKLPDLVVIDGGKGQLSAALKGMARAGVFASNGGHRGKKVPVGGRSAAVPVVSLAKNLEEVFAPDRSGPINESPDSAALLLLRSLRDESHRFALTNHRRRRSKLSGIK